MSMKSIPLEPHFYIEKLGFAYGRQKPSKVPFLNEIDKIEMN